MNTQQRLTYLAAMDISVWQVRCAGCFYYRLYDAQQCLRGVLLAEAEHCDVAKQSLVEAIAKAISKQSEGGFYDHYPQDIASVKVIIFLGSTIAAHYQTQLKGQVITTHSLADMQKDPALKKPVWQEIKKAITLIG